MRLSRRLAVLAAAVLVPARAHAGVNVFTTLDLSLTFAEKPYFGIGATVAGMAVTSAWDSYVPMGELGLFAQGRWRAPGVWSAAGGARLGVNSPFDNSPAGYTPGPYANVDLGWTVRTRGRPGPLVGIGAGVAWFGLRYSEVLAPPPPDPNLPLPRWKPNPHQDLGDAATTLPGWHPRNSVSDRTLTFSGGPPGFVPYYDPYILTDTLD